MMKAAILYGPSDVRLEEVELPEPANGEVLLKIKAALTCGTDAKVYLRGGHPRMIKPPAVFGHEFSGVVEKAGKGVEKFRVGMRVVSANSAPCNMCFYCKRNQKALCVDLLFINGAYAEYVKIPSRIVQQNLLEVPENVSFEEAALVEPLACVLHGIDLSGIKPGNKVVISGAGPIGLLFVQLSKLSGAYVISLDAKEERLDIAKKCGADVAMDVSQIDDEVKAVREITKGPGADVAIEAVGIPSVWEKTVKMIRKGGTAVLFGGCAPGTKVSFDTELIHYSELTIKGVFHHTPYYIEEALELLRQKKVNSSLLITGRLPLSKLSEALLMITNKIGVKTSIFP